MVPVERGELIRVVHIDEIVQLLGVVKGGNRLIWGVGSAFAFLIRPRF